jgi:hypothetical protein
VVVCKRHLEAFGTTTTTTKRCCVGQFCTPFFGMAKVSMGGICDEPCISKALSLSAGGFVSFFLKIVSCNFHFGVFTVRAGGGGGGGGCVHHVAWNAPMCCQNSY